MKYSPAAHADERAFPQQLPRGLVLAHGGELLRAPQLVERGVEARGHRAVAVQVAFERKLF
jgi:hypothetical protein